MSTETIALIIAIIALVVAMATQYVTYRMYIYTQKSDRQKSKQVEDARRKEILKQIKVKESQLKSLDDYSWFPRDQFTAGNMNSTTIARQRSSSFIPTAPSPTTR